MSFRLFLAASLITCMNCDAQRLDRFGKANRISYDRIATYFGYADSLSKPDEVRNDTGYYHMYFWLNDSVSELGVRMISPVPEVVMPDRGDLVSENYYENEKDKVNYFDPWISLERSNEISILSDVAKTKTETWIPLAFNDDSAELFKQPSGNAYNSLLRIRSATAGLYRIRFTSYKKGKVRGSYLIQVGATKKMPLNLVKNPEELKLN
jgi:hypothetical protein